MSLPDLIERRLDAVRGKLDRRVAILVRRVRRTPAGKRASGIFRVLRGVALGFRGEHINLRAGNLTFITIFSLAPLLTVALALLRLVDQVRFQGHVRRFIRELLAPGIQEDSAAFLERFLSAASSRTAGGLSFLALMLSAGMLLKHLDASLNEIWAVKRPRPLAQSIALYGLALVVGPFLLGLWLAGTAAIRSALLSAELPFSRQWFSAGTAALAVVVFGCLYRFIPSSPVRFRSAAIGGVVGGLGWETSRYVYAHLVAMGFHSNPIYGSLGAAPIFLTWIYVSWWTVLLGARLAYAVEHAHLRADYRDFGEHPRSLQLVAGRLALELTSAVEHGAPGPTVRQLARRLSLPGPVVEELVRQLVHHGLLQEDAFGGLEPAKPPTELTLADIATAVAGWEPTPEARSPEAKRLERYFRDADAQAQGALAAISWKALAESAPSAPPGVDSGSATPAPAPVGQGSSDARSRP